KTAPFMAAPSIPVEGSRVKLDSGAICIKGNISAILIPPYISSSLGHQPDHLTDAASSADASKNALIDINQAMAPIMAITHHALDIPIPSRPTMAIDMNAVAPASLSVLTLFSCGPKQALNGCCMAMVFMMNNSPINPVDTTVVSMAGMPILPAMAAENPITDMAAAPESSTVHCTSIGIFI